MSSFGNEYFLAEKVRVIKNISDPDYFRVEKIRIIDNVGDPDYFRADKIRIIDNVNDYDYFRVKKVRISNISDPDYFRIRKVREVKLPTYSTPSRQGSGGMGGFCLVVIAVLLVGGLITAISTSARPYNSATDYTPTPLEYSSTLDVSNSISTSEIKDLITPYYNEHNPYPGILVVKSIGDMSFAKQNDNMFKTCAEITDMSLPGEPSEGDKDTYFYSFQFEGYGSGWTITSEGDAYDTMEQCTYYER